MSSKRRHHKHKKELSDAGAVAPEKADHSEQETEDTDQQQNLTSFSVLLVHVTWFFLGPLLLLVLLIAIINLGNGWTSILDIVFFVVAAIVIGCRWIDQRSGQATNSSGEPATWDDFRRYVTWMPIAALAAWIAANVLGNHILNGS